MIPTTLIEIDGQEWAIEMINNLLVEVYTSLAQQEVSEKERRQKEGIEIAKAKGVYKGRKPIEYDPIRFEELYKRWKAGSIMAKEFMALIGLSRIHFIGRCSVMNQKSYLPYPNHSEAKMNLNNKLSTASVMIESDEDRPIAIDAFRTAGQDLFALIIEVDKVARLHDIATIGFINKVFSTKSREEQIGYIIDVLKVLQVQEAQKAQKIL